MRRFAILVAALAGCANDVPASRYGDGPLVERAAAECNLEAEKAVGAIRGDMLAGVKKVELTDRCMAVMGHEVRR